MDFPKEYSLVKPSQEGRFTPEQAAELAEKHGAWMYPTSVGLTFNQLAAMLNAELSEREETIAQLTRALREATEPDTFMGVPVEWTPQPKPQSEPVACQFQKCAEHKPCPRGSAGSCTAPPDHTALLRQASEAMKTTLGEQESYIKLNNLDGLDNQHLRYLRETIAAITKALEQS